MIRTHEQIESLDDFSVPEPTPTGENEATTQMTQVAVMECLRALRRARVDQGQGLRARPPYGPASLGRAIAMGIDPSGDRLGVGMPRYRLSTLADLEERRATNPRFDTLARFALALNVEIALTAGPVDPEYLTDFAG